MKLPMAAIGMILGILIVGLIVVAIAPSLFSSLGTVNQTGWTATTVTLWAVVVLVFVIALIIAILSVIEKGKQ